MIRNTRTTFLLGSLLLFLFTKAEGQLSPAETLQKYQQLYPEESGIISEIQRVVNIKRKGDSLEIKSSQYEEVLILDKPSRWVKEKVYSSSFSKVDSIEAYTLLPGKRKYKKIPVTDFKRSYDKNSYIFFDDTEVIHFNFPQLVEGAKIVTSKRWKSIDPHVLGSFYFASYVPTLHASFKIVVEEGIRLDHGLVNDSTLNISYTEEVQKDGSIIYTYEAYDIPKVDFEDNNPGFGYLSPSAYIIIADYKNSQGEQKPILSSLEDLHNWYQTFINNMTIDSAIYDLADGLIDESDSEMDIVRKVFYWVQANIKYVAFEDGMRGLIPHQADYVVEKRYGDCKDMTSILVGLLRSKGIDARFTWVGTREIPYRYTEIPSPIVDNHMIASVEVDGQIFFLDATGSYSPLGYPTSMIQGKESLINRNNDFEIVEVPIIPKEKNQTNDTSTLWLKDGVVFGEGKLTISGLAKVANTHKLIQKTSKAEGNAVRKLLSRGNNKFLVDQYDLKYVNDLDKPVEVSYSFNIADYYREVDGEIYINLCLDRSLINNLIKDRKTPFENDYKLISTSHTKLQIPEGYKVKYIPEGGSCNSSHLGFDISYEQDANSLIFSSSIYLDFLVLYPDAFDSWNSVIDKYAQITRRTIVLEKI